MAKKLDVKEILSNLEDMNTINIALAGIFTVCFVGMLVSFAIVGLQGGKARETIANAAELRVLSQRIAKNAVEAANGNEEAFALLEDAKDEFTGRWNELQSKTSGGMEEEAAALAESWGEIQENAEIMVEAEDIVLEMHSMAESLGTLIPEMQQNFGEIAEILKDTRASADQVGYAERQSWLAERMVRSISVILDGGEDAAVAAEVFEQDAALFSEVLLGMLEGNAEMGIPRVRDGDAIELLTATDELFQSQVLDSVDEIVGTATDLFDVQDAASIIFDGSQEVLDDATNFFKKAEEKGTLGIAGIIGIFFLVVAVAAGGALAFFIVTQARTQNKTIEDENQKNQEAILRLLDELGDLADGDLTVQATVTEDFTGAIADSINFSIDQLRELVQTINQTAVQVSSAAQETQSTAMHLAEASEHQAQEIAGASAAVNEMAVSIDQVSANAAESTAVAERSVAIANKGAEVVQATISGMDTIREQIQETSKRIKRLGESSQEIGDIISLINDIADQTNILSLNAAIQASMAGDAGRGFAVVADEVQRLAERSSAATKQIESLVKTIQTDTNEAVISMEQTTAEVVKGARLAQDAGVALEEIENVSKNLADLIQNISNAARQQAASAGHISNTMNVIQEITSQTSAGTTATAQSIGNLTEMAAAMRDSVAGFTLPESV